MTASAWPVRTLTDEQWPEFVALDGHAFGETSPDELVEAIRAGRETGRDIGAFDGDTMVGIATAYSLQMSVPGGALVPTAGVSWVGVLPTHRRRGVLGSLMTHQLDHIHDAGREPIAALWASEPPIYGRFGYGPASQHWFLKVPRSARALVEETPTDPSLRLRIVPADDWRVTQPVYDEVLATRPGMLARDEHWWTRAVRDLTATRGGRSALRAVVAEDDSAVRGYARYATTQTHDEGFGQGTVSVREVLAADTAALALLYRYLCDLDLMTSTHLENVPVDDPLVHWLTNPRHGNGLRRGDALYVRLIDLGAALTARTYTTEVDVVLDVTDRHCPWNAGRWRLRGGPAGATCDRLGDREAGGARLTLDVRELGAAYLGGTTLTERAQAGFVAGPVEVVRATSAAFASTPAPWCPIVF